ncbi:MAG: acyl phosphate:glycerol-3-phosphate acyltransferase [Actinomycetota bacterium]|nr:acyl phosphate:glycerol-3-phosphate acyltransferase [Actinomycetota bacterium]
MIYAAAGLVGYLIGAVSPATWLAARRGIDLRGVGSGNPGATNAGRALGRRTGVIVALLDVLKGFVVAVGFEYVDHRAGLVAGVAAVVGHVTSPFLRGRGGKGVATALGAILGSQPLWAPIVLLVWVIVVAVSRWVALASVLAATSIAVIAVVVDEDIVWAVVLAAIVVVRHQTNFVRRLARG